MSSKQAAFARNENIRNYRQRLKTESDPEMRGMLSRLLAEELARPSPPRGRAPGKRPEPAGGT